MSNLVFHNFRGVLCYNLETEGCFIYANRDLLVEFKRRKADWKEFIINNHACPGKNALYPGKNALYKTHTQGVPVRLLTIGNLLSFLEKTCLF